MLQSRAVYDLLTHLRQHWWMPALMALALIPVVQYDSLLFHTLVELFASGIALVCFIVAWNTHTLAHNQYLLMLGCGYYTVGMLDMAHAMTFGGMPFFPSLSGNVTIQFWIVSRFAEAFMLLLAPLSMLRHFQPRTILLASLCVLFASTALVVTGQLPDMFIDGQGLTPVKVMCEYLIIIILLAAVWVLQRQRQQIDARVLLLTYTSIAMTIAAELSFTLYADFHSLSLVVGHFLKLFSFWAIYVALIESSLREPFRNLARDANTYDAIPDETILVDSKGIVRQVNQAVRKHSGLTSDQAVGRHCHELQHDHSQPAYECEICQSIAAGKPLTGHQYYDRHWGQWYEVSLSDIRHGAANAGMVHVRRNISATKQAEERSITLNKLYSVLTQTNKVISQADSIDKVLQDICFIAQRYGGFSMAWIGFIDGHVIRPKASSGDHKGYLSSIEVRIDDSELAYGPIGSAARENRVTCVNNTLSDPTFEPWRKAARERGYSSLAAVPLHNNGRVIGICAFYSSTAEAFDPEMLALLATLGADISVALERLQQKLAQAETQHKLSQLSMAVEQSDNAIVITDTDFHAEYVNRSFVEMTGFELTEVQTESPMILYSNTKDKDPISELVRVIRSGRQWDGELQITRKDGSTFWASQSISPLMDDAGDIVNYVSTFEDITNLHHAQQTIEQLAFFDPLTNLPNRRLLADRLNQAIESCRRQPDSMVAVLMFDLDNFKTVNDSLGHNLGDELLQQVAAIFSQQVRKEDTVARLGGDEFTIILSNMHTVGKIADIADAIIQKLKQPIDVSGHQVVIGTSIGISVYPGDTHNPDELIRNADIAMYHAKGEGKNNFQFFTANMNEKAQQRLEMENRLRHAIEHDHFELYYQPQIDLLSGRITGVEALIRWNDPQRGMISPLEFIPLAEDTGMIGPIGDWVIRTACHELKALQAQGFPAVKVAVNVSAYQFQHGKHLADVIDQALQQSQLAPEYLSLEVTESLLIDGIREAGLLLEELRKRRITIAIDDFGTGYSSLSYLKQLPIDVLKIDQSFIRDLLDDPSDEAIVSAIIAMAHKLDIKVLAEGVESNDHQAMLIQQECDFAQGFLYCRPLPKDELLRAWAEQPAGSR